MAGDGGDEGRRFGLLADEQVLRGPLRVGLERAHLAVDPAVGAQKPRDGPAQGVVGGEREGVQRDHRGDGDHPHRRRLRAQPLQQLLAAPGAGEVEA